MAEGFEPFHVPQQIRRDKLRFLGHESPGFQTIYDPSLELPPPYDFHHPLSGDCKPNAVKAKSAANLMMGNYAIANPNFPDLLPFQQINPFLYDHQSVNGSGSLQSLSRHDPIMGTGQGLSLSLSSSSQRNPHQEIFSRAGPVSVGPLGPFTGYASILSGSRFLRPARQLLEEFCGSGSEGPDSQKVDADSPVHSLGEIGASDGGDDGFVCGGKPKLVSMLDEVYRKYKQYYQQLQAVVASFESVSGLGNAAPYANLALKAMSRHFRSLKNAITGQLQFTKKTHGLSTGDQSGLYSGPRPVQNLGFLEPHQPVWRTQRGLPERAVTVLRAWLFEHFLHPYPSDSDKIMLAKQTGLSRSQVSNWFINARVRLWKPMVEEIHILETRQASQTTSQRDEQSCIGTINARNDRRFAEDNPLEAQYKDHHHHRDLVSAHQPVNFCYGELANDMRASSNVSLTLGLHNGNGLSEPPFQRFGDPNGGDYVMGDGFEAQNRHFGGQLLHDFVG